MAFLFKLERTASTVDEMQRNYESGAHDQRRRHAE
jgi:hypothetical protein